MGLLFTLCLAAWTMRRSPAAIGMMYMAIPATLRAVPPIIRARNAIAPTHQGPDKHETEEVDHP